MSLRQQLKQILPSLLPKESSEAMKGTELIRLVKFRLKQDYSDATLRYHFSVLSADPSAPIAKVTRGQGYFLRPNTKAQLDAAASLIGLRQTSFIEDARAPEEIDQELQRLGKFRAIIERWLLSNQRFPFFFDQAYSGDASRATPWNFPEAVAVTWNVAAADDTAIKLDQKIIDRQRMLGAPLFSLTGIKLRIDLSLERFREDFFQALSQSEWANVTDFLIAAPIDDASLADALGALGQRHGIGVLSFGLTPIIIDALPSAPEISAMSSSEFDALLSKASITRLSEARELSKVNWPKLTGGGSPSTDSETLFAWLEHCLATGNPMSSADFLATHGSLNLLSRNAD